MVAARIASSRLGQVEEPVGGQCSGSPQRHQLAVAVSCRQVGTNAQCVQQPGQGDTRDPQGWLRHPGVGDGRKLGRPRFGVERRGREQQVGPACTFAEHLAQMRERHVQVAEHARPLRTLPRVNERHFCVFGHGVGPVDAGQGRAIRAAGGRCRSGGRCRPGGLGRCVCGRQHRRQLGPQVGRVGGDHTHLRRARTSGPHGGGQVAERLGGGAVVVEVAHQLVDHHLRCSQGGPGKNEELGGPGGEPMGRCRLAVGRLDHGVEVGAAEPKPRHPRRAVFVQPRGGAAVQPERAGGGVPVVVGGGDVVGRWSHPRGHGVPLG